jgi:hypothetical protein
MKVGSKVVASISDSVARTHTTQNNATYIPKYYSTRYTQVS